MARHVERVMEQKDGYTDATKVRDRSDAKTTSDNVQQIDKFSSSIADALQPSLTWRYRSDEFPLANSMFGSDIC